MTWSTLARLAALLAVSCGALSCGGPTDAERLQLEIDTTSVHMYLALKVLTVEPERDADVKRARELLDAALVAMGEEKGAGAGLQPSDAIAVGRALWALREIGEAEVKAGRGSKLAPVFNDLGSYAPGVALDRSSDHALLLLALMLAKLHPDGPTPVPAPLLLYEAFMTGEQPLGFAPLEPLARSAQAYAYAGAELCDLAVVHTQQLADKPIVMTDAERQELLTGFTGLGRFAAHASPDAAFAIAFVATMPWWSRIVAHLTTAKCLDGRERKEEATREWQRAIDIAEQVGFAPADLALVRAYIAYRSDDTKRMREHLIVARDSKLLDDQARRDVDALAKHFDEENQDAVTRLFNPLFVTGLVVKMSFTRMKEAGVFDALAATPAFQKARSVVGALETVTTSSEGMLSALWEGASWLKQKLL